MAFAALPLLRIAALGPNAKNTSFVVSVMATEGYPVMVEYSAARPWRSFWNPPKVVVLGNLHLNLLMKAPGGRGLFGTMSTTARARTQTQFGGTSAFDLRCTAGSRGTISSWQERMLCNERSGG